MQNVNNVLSVVVVKWVDQRLACTNTIDYNIQFTSEREKEYAISFLDAEIVHNPDGSLSTRVYYTANPPT